MENSHELFDDSIRAKLENLKVSGTPDWETLESKIDADLQADPFDEMIKSKLEGGQVTYDPGLWSLMESKIEADADLSMSELEDVEFDGLLYENLHDYKVPYNSNHWDLMLQRIKEEFSVQHHLYKYKVAEVSLVALIIFTLLQFLPGDLHFSKNKDADQVVLNNTFTESTVDKMALVVLPTISMDAVSNKENTNSHNATSIVAAAKKQSLTTTTQDYSNNTNTNSLATAKKSSAGLAEADFGLPPLVKKEYGGTSISTTAITAMEAAEIATAAAKEQQLAAQLFDQSLLGLLTLESMQSEAFEGVALAVPDCKWCQVPKPWIFKLGMLASIDFNMVMTPYDEYFSSASYDQLTSGYTGGINFSIHRNRMGLATGANYSSKAYEVKDNKEVVGSLIEGYSSQGLEAAQLNILSIPVNLTYTFDNKGKWQWYGLIGASAKIATVNNYDYRSAPLTARSAFPVDPRIVESTEVENVSPADPYTGFLEGGDFKKNFFVTANLGIGMERYVTPRWSVFVQPTYQHSLYKKGLGPNSDRIHSMSLFLGTRATLK